MKIKTAICLRITPRKIPNHTEAFQHIYIPNWRTGLHMAQSLTRANLETDLKFNRTVKIR